MPGLIGKKVGMTSIFSPEGKNWPCTVLEVGPCVVTQVKTEDVDGYNAIQLGWGEAKEKNVSKALQGHVQKASTSVKKKFVEFTDFEGGLELGQVLTADLFE
ncbi:MAG: 50S ribosomal protein L3, partial [Schleiferiaceae bacterium]|nr:50S ribosomal protein L3 [Schleiferiaceae bacterium]